MVVFVYKHYLLGNTMAVRSINIKYEKNKMAPLFTDTKKLERKIGKDSTRSLIKVINRFRAAANYEDIIAYRIGNPHSLSGNLNGYQAINVTANLRLVYKIEVADTVTVKGVCDYHGEKINWIIP
jgi:Plasmid maintenance system killer protein.